MNTISLCRKAPELPEFIHHDLLVVQMITLEHRLAATNPLFEEDLYMGLLTKLASIYFQVNRFCDARRMIVESSIEPDVVLKPWERHGK